MVIFLLFWHFQLTHFSEIKIREILPDLLFFSYIHKYMYAHQHMHTHTYIYIYRERVCAFLKTKLTCCRHLSWFYFLATINSAIINTGVQISLCADSESLGCMPRRIAESYYSSFFSSLSDFHNDFHCNYTSFHSHQQWIKVSLSLYPHQHLVLIIFVIIAILTNVRRILKAVIICVSLVGK